METKVLINSSQDSSWEQISRDLGENDPLDYQVVLEMEGRQTVLNIDVDLGGGFEGGYALTSFSTQLHYINDFRFAIHPEDFVDEIGKFFGMQDLMIGYADFDKEMIIKTNHREKVTEMFGNSFVREVFQSLKNFSFGIVYHHIPNSTDKHPFLELSIEDAVTNTTELKKLYQAYFEVLKKIE